MAEDDDLDDLDDLLDDFQDEVLSKPPGAMLKEEKKGSVKSQGEISGDVKKKGGSDEKSDRSAEKHDSGNTTGKEDKGTGKEGQGFEALLNEMSQTDPELSAELRSFVKEISEVDKGDYGIQHSQGTSAGDTVISGLKKKNFQEAISETVHRLKSSGDQVDESIKNENKNDNMLEALMKSLSLDTGEKTGKTGDASNSNDAGDINSLLAEMLDQLSSKSVLYEPLNDLYLKFGPWLKDPAKKLDPDYSKYEKQYGLVKALVLRFQQPTYNDSNADDKKFINDNLESLQELGLPPKELMNDDLGFLSNKKDGNGLNNLKFTDEDIPDEVGKELEETCQQK